jgi:hypothetical protein
MKLFTKEIDNKLFKQYPMGANLENQVVVAKIFNPYGRGVWYLLNSDPNDPDYIWAIVDLIDVEMSSVSRSELEELRVPPFRLPLERDLYFAPISAKSLYEGLLKGKQYAEGGTTSTEILISKDGDAWLFPQDPSGKDYGIKLAQGGETKKMDRVQFVQDMFIRIVNYDNLLQPRDDESQHRWREKMTEFILEDPEDYVFTPLDLVYRAYLSGLYDLNDLNEETMDNARSEAQDVASYYKGSGEGFGSSDFTASLNNFLNDEGIKTAFVNGRLERLDENGQVSPRDSRYAHGGETKSKFLHDVRKLHRDIKEIKLKDGSIVTHEEMMNAHKMAKGGELMSNDGDIPYNAIKKMQKIRVNELNGWLPGDKYIWHDAPSKKFYFKDFEGRIMAINNDATLAELDKFIKKNNISLEDVTMAKGGKTPPVVRTQFEEEEFEYAKGGEVAKYNVSFNYNPSNLSNEDAEKIAEKYTKDWKHNNDFDEVSFYVLSLSKENSDMLVKELKMEDVYNIEVDKSRYANGGKTTVVEEFGSMSFRNQYDDYEMVVIAKELEKDGGYTHTFRYLVSAKDIQEAKEIATGLWEQGMSNSDLHIVKVMSDEAYRLNYMGKYDGGGELKEDFLEDLHEMHQDIDTISLQDGTTISGKELHEAHKMAHGGEVKAGDVLEATTGVKVKVVEYDPKFGGRVRVERMDEYATGKPSHWMFLTKFKMPKEEKKIEEPKKAPRNKEALKKKLNEFKKGGEIKKKATFNDKVDAISKSLEGKKVKSKYKGKYGATYDRKEAKEAAKNIVGKIRAKYGK